MLMNFLCEDVVVKGMPPLFFLVSMLLLGVSAYYTMIGVTKSIDSIIIGSVVACALGLGMFGLISRLYAQRVNKQPILLTLVIYAIFASISTAFGFHGLYVKNQESVIYAKELQEKKDTIKNVVATANQALNGFSPEKGKIAEILGLKNQLIMQINDPANQGCGERCKDIKKKLETLIGHSLTEFSGSPQQQSKSYSELIDNEVKKIKDSGNLNKAFALMQKNEQLKDEVVARIDATLYSEEKIKNEGRATIMDAVDKINTISVETEKLINKPEMYMHTVQKFENSKLGKVGFSLEHAINNPKDAVFWISISLFIDWISIILCLGIATNNQNSNSSPKGKKNGENIVV